MTEFQYWTSFWKFQHEVTSRRGLAHSTEVKDFLKALLDTSLDRQQEVPKGEPFFRSQKGHDWEVIDENDNRQERPYGAERMKPLQNNASDGRANADGIPCLYLGTTEECSIAETRPWIGSFVSVAQFITSRDLTVIDCSHTYDKRPLHLTEPDAGRKAKAVWAHVDRAFSEPTTRDDDSLDYVPTQIIAKMFKSNGFDGVAYKSNFGQDGFNIALFDLDAAHPINCILHKVTSVSVGTKKVSNPCFFPQK